MITNAFLYFITGLVGLITLPLQSAADVSVSASVFSAIQIAGSYIHSLDAVAPMSELLIVLSLVIGVDTAIFAYKAIMWVVRRFPTQS